MSDNHGKTAFRKSSRLFSLSDYEISLHGQFVYYSGFKNEWDMKELNVDGTITGSPTWTRAQIGPKIRYEGLNTIYPFISATFNKLWGTFTVDQDIQNLFGTEEKKITGKSNFTFSAGSEFMVTSNFLVNGVLSGVSRYPSEFRQHRVLPSPGRPPTQHRFLAGPL